MRAWPLLRGLLLGAALAADPAAAAHGQLSGDWHESAPFGFRFRPPKDWMEIALPPGELSKAAKYLSDRSYFYTDDRGGRTLVHRPELLVLSLAAADPDGDEPRDYADYLERTFPAGGYDVEAREESEVGALRVEKYSILVGATATAGPKRITTWVFERPGGALAMQIDVLEPEFKKLRRTVEGALGSFEPIEPTGEATAGARVADIAGSTPEERRAARLASEEREHAAALAGLAEGWSQERVGDLFVLHHGVEKHARRLAEHLEALEDWLEETFPYIGPDEYVRRPILRVCKDASEEAAHLRGRGPGPVTGPRSLELVTYDDKYGFLHSYAVDRCNESFLEYWLCERDDRLYDGLPTWLSYGLREGVEGTRAKGRRIELRADELARDELLLLVTQGKASSPRELMTLGRAQYAGDRLHEAEGLVRFLLSPEGARDKLGRARQASSAPRGWTPWDETSPTGATWRRHGGRHSHWCREPVS